LGSGDQIPRAGQDWRRDPRSSTTVLIGVALPELAIYVARLGIVAVSMAAYGIPVSFYSVVAVSASNSLSNVLSVTPGGAGVNQSFNVAVLDSTTSSANAAACSLAQQLIISAWDVLFAIVLVSWVFGWSGGKQLVKESYAGGRGQGPRPQGSASGPADRSTSTMASARQAEALMGIGDRAIIRTDVPRAGAA
jgi:hypothetical protein